MTKTYEQLLGKCKLSLFCLTNQKIIRMCEFPFKKQSLTGVFLQIFTKFYINKDNKQNKNKQFSTSS